MNRCSRVTAVLLLVALLTAIQAHWLKADMANRVPTWRAEWGGFNSIADFEVLADGRVLAVGSNLIVGDSIERGSRWRAIDNEDVPQYYNTIDLVGGSGWAVGDSCIQRIEGGKPLGCSPNSLGIYSISLESPGEGWALGMGSGGEPGFVRLTRSESSFRQDATAGVPNRLWVHESGDGWATAGNGQMYHLKDGEWSVVSTPVSRTLSLVGGLAPGDVWAATGTRPGPPPVTTPIWDLLHFDGDAWSVADEGVGYGYAALAMGHGTGYLAEWEGTIHQLENGTWHRLEARVPASRFQAVSALRVLDDGTALVATEAGGMYHVVDGRVEAAFEPGRMSGIWLAGSRGWAVDGRTALERVPDGGWQPMPTDSSLHTLTNLDGLESDDAWGVGLNGAIMHFDGVRWSTIPSPTTIDLTRVRVVSPDLAWAVGAEIDHGIIHSIVLRYDGDRWESVWERSGNYDTEIRDAVGSVPDDPWVVSGNKLWRIRGGTWATVGPGDEVWSVDVTHDGVWAGGSGVLYRYVDNLWNKELVIPGGSQIHGLRMRHGLVAAWYGAVFQLDAAAWTWRRLRGSVTPAADYGVPYALFDAAPVLDGSGVAVQIYAVGAQSSVLSELPVRDPMTPTPPAHGEQSRLFLPSLRNEP